MPEYELRETLLKIDGVCLTLGGKLILRDVHAEVKNVHREGMSQGQVVGLLGPSGVGKTRLFRILAGLDAPDSGKVLLGAEGKPVKRGSVGVVAQDYPLFAHRTVLGNLLVAARQQGMSPGEGQKKAAGILERFGLTGNEKKYPAQLSGGMRQRVSIAQQLLCSDELLLMDEPFSGLDLVALGTVMKFLGEIAASDELKTFVIVTHDIEAAMEVCDTLWLLGRDRDEKNNLIPGARVQKVYDLMERGLAWRDGIADDPAYLQLLREIREIFPRL